MPGRRPEADTDSLESGPGSGQVRSGQARGAATALPVETGLAAVDRDSIPSPGGAYGVRSTEYLTRRVCLEVEVDVHAEGEEGAAVLCSVSALSAQ